MTKDSSKHNLKHAAAKGMFWGGVSNAVCQVLSLFFGIFLARILGPDDYGPVGVLAIFSAIAGSLQDGGFVAAIANRKTVTHDDYNAVFWFSIIISLFMYGVLYSCAPFIADFFKESFVQPGTNNITITKDEFIDLSRYNFLGFVVAGFGVAPSAYLFRELKVKQKSIAMMLSIAATGIVGIAMALNGYSYWGIATQSITYVLVRTIVVWSFTPWRPTFKANFAPLKYLFAFSYRLLITNVFQRFNWNIFSFILGKRYKSEDVGNYTKSAEWFNMGGEVVNGMVNAVAQPILAKVVDDRERSLRVFRKMMRFTAFMAFPLMFGLSLAAVELITIVITDKWYESARMLQVLAIWGAFMPLQSMFTNLLVSSGRSKVFMWCTIVQGMLTLGLLLAMSSMGIRPMLVAYCVFNALWLLVWLHFAKKEIHIKLSMFLHDVLPYMFMSAFVMSVTYLVTKPIEDIYILLFAKIVIAASMYIILAYIMRSEELSETIAFLSGRKK
ncbi:MAG: lipopolysaccharide biosynthesis protein [Bacteroidaceae bacterium]|nr:lipopolysaccharide biosynthesis protein [Bacteroidaceae bacterium]